MGMELRIRATNWTKDQIELAKETLRRIYPHADYYAYETVSTSFGGEITLEDLEQLYEDELQEQADELEIHRFGHQLKPWSNLTPAEIQELAETLVFNPIPDGQSLPVKTAEAQNVEQFIRANSQWLQEIPVKEENL